MIIINGHQFYEEPGSCGACPFLLTGNSRMSQSDKGVCIQWDETHHTWAATPRRCGKLFRQAFANYYDGAELVIVGKESHGS